jgi:hypothetical protein
MAHNSWQLLGRCKMLNLKGCHRSMAGENSPMVRSWTIESGRVREKQSGSIKRTLNSAERDGADGKPPQLAYRVEVL